MKTKIHLLHGFLGQPSDWDNLFPADKHIVAPDLFHGQPIVPFDMWADIYNAGVSKKDNSVLVGYSLGGRLALHAITREPEKWKAAIFVSTHWGLMEPEEKAKRLVADAAWADRFETEAWDSLMQAWNSQDTLQAGGFAFKRHEHDYQRSKLAKALRVWSLGHQENMLSQIAALKIPVLWITGLKDKKFTDMTTSIYLQHPISRVCIMTESGHRVPWQQPDSFVETVNDFITQVEQYQS